MNAFARSAGLLIWFSAVLIFPGSARSVGAEERKTLRGHVPGNVPQLQAVGRLNATTNLSLALGLPLRNKEALTNLLEQLYDPTSSRYHHYLTSEEFAARFGPSEDDYRKAIGFARGNGL